MSQEQAAQCARQSSLSRKGSHARGHFCDPVGRTVPADTRTCAQNSKGPAQEEAGTPGAGSRAVTPCAQDSPGNRHLRSTPQAGAGRRAAAHAPGSSWGGPGKAKMLPVLRGPGDAPRPPGAAETSGSQHPALRGGGSPTVGARLSSLRPSHGILKLARPGVQADRPSKECLLKGVSTGSAVARSPFLLSL